MNKNLPFVSAINNGTVIDHIATGQALTIIQLLGLASGNQQISVGINLQSKELGRKDVIKLENIELSIEEANQLAIFSPKATIHIIKNSQVVKRFKIGIPKILQNLILCPNKSCITNSEKIPTYFFINNQEKRLQLQCKYCEDVFTKNEIKVGCQS